MCVSGCGSRGWVRVVLARRQACLQVSESVQRFQHGEPSETQLFWGRRTEIGEGLKMSRSACGARVGRGSAWLIGGREMDWTGLEAGRPEEEESLAGGGKGTGTSHRPLIPV